VGLSRHAGRTHLKKNSGWKEKWSCVISAEQWAMAKLAGAMITV
jgi:hypothetical protein